MSSSYSWWFPDTCVKLPTCMIKPIDDMHVPVTVVQHCFRNTVSVSHFHLLQDQDLKMRGITDNKHSRANIEICLLVSGVVNWYYPFHPIIDFKEGNMHIGLLENKKKKKQKKQKQKTKTKIKKKTKKKHNKKQKQTKTKQNKKKNHIEHSCRRNISRTFVSCLCKCLELELFWRILHCFTHRWRLILSKMSE